MTILQSVLSKDFALLLADALESVDRARVQLNNYACRSSDTPWNVVTAESLLTQARACLAMAIRESGHD